ncbi:hypothetical protein ACSQ67_014443 [Phaseolus vulgaris]
MFLIDVRWSDEDGILAPMVRSRILDRMSGNDARWKRKRLREGGLSPELHNLNQIKSLPRPSEVSETGLLCDLLWSDPSNDIRGWGENERGVSYTFGVDRVTEFLQKHDFDLICRAHQVVEDGYEFFADRQLVTIFSAPKYCGEFDNAGAMMTVDESLVSSFQILKPVDKKPIVYFALGALPQLSLVLQQKPSNHFLVLKHDLMNVTTISKCLVHRKKCLVFTLV